MPAQVTADMTIAEVLEATADAADVLLDHGMTCVGCSIARMGTLEEGARLHKVNLQALVDDLNAALAKTTPHKE